MALNNLENFARNASGFFSERIKLLDRDSVELRKILDFMNLVALGPADRLLFPQRTKGLLPQNALIVVLEESILQREVQFLNHRKLLASLGLFLLHCQIIINLLLSSLIIEQCNCFSPPFFSFPLSPPSVSWAVSSATSTTSVFFATSLKTTFSTTKPVPSFTTSPFAPSEIWRDNAFNAFPTISSTRPTLVSRSLLRI